MIQKARFKFRTFRFLRIPHWNAAAWGKPACTHSPPLFSSHPCLALLCDWPCIQSCGPSRVQVSRFCGHFHTATLGHLMGQEVYRPEAHFIVGGQNQGNPYLDPARRLREFQGPRMYSGRESCVGGHVLLNLWTPHTGSRAAIREGSEQCHLN